MGGFRWGLGRFFGLFGPSSRAVYGATLVFFGNLSADESKFNFLILLWPVRSGILVCSQFYLTVISCLMCCGLRLGRDLLCLSKKFQMTIVRLPNRWSGTKQVPRVFLFPPAAAKTTSTANNLPRLQIIIAE